MGDFKKAIMQFNKTIQMNPNYAEAYFSLGMTYGAMSEYDKAVKELEKAAELSNRRLVIIANLAYIYLKKGRKDKALSIINELDERSKTEDVSSFNYLPYYVGLKDFDKVFELFDEAYQKKYGLLLYIKTDHMFGTDNEFRKDPRFIDLLKRIGI
jgi:tetratricopeptide (TPR) repeat protein